MGIPTIDNLVLPTNRILVLQDQGSDPVGVIKQYSTGGGGVFKLGGGVGDDIPEIEYTHVLYVEKMTEKVRINGVVYLAMSEDAIVGLID